MTRSRLRPFAPSGGEFFICVMLIGDFSLFQSDGQKSPPTVQCSCERDGISLIEACGKRALRALEGDEQIRRPGIRIHFDLQAKTSKRLAYRAHLAGPSHLLSLELLPSLVFLKVSLFAF